MRNYKSILLFISTIGTSYLFYILYNKYKRNSKKREYVIKLLEQIKTSSEKGVLIPKLTIPSDSSIFKNLFKSPDKKNNPIILVPDFGSSKLYYKWTKEDKKYLYKPIEKDWEKVWLTINALSPNINDSDEWKEKITINYQSSNDEKFLDNSDVNITAWRKSNYNKKGNFRCTNDFGYIDCVDKLLKLTGSQTYEAYIFHNLIEILKEKGYSDGVNLFGSSYDFRKIYITSLYGNLF